MHTLLELDTCDSTYTYKGVEYSDVIDFSPDHEFHDILHGVGQTDEAGRHMRLTLFLSGAAIKGVVSGTWAEFDREGNFHMGGEVYFARTPRGLVGGWSTEDEDGQLTDSGDWTLTSRWIRG